MYAGIAELARLEGVALTERAQAKVGLLAIMYGGRSGEIGALLPHVAKLFPRAMEFTERAARIGEVGGQVTTFWGAPHPHRTNVSNGRSQTVLPLRRSRVLSPFRALTGV